MNFGQYSEKAAQKIWQNWLEQYAIQPIQPLKAITFQRAWRTKAQPILLQCEDSQNYMVKGQQAGRQIVNDQIVARLGECLGAPVGRAKIIEITDLVAIEPKMADIAPGTAHGTGWIEQCFDSYTLIATSEEENRLRLMLLAILYGWVEANDHQFLFNASPPRLIHSVDHGHFFPKGPDWTIADLASASPARLDPYFVECHFTPDQMSQGRQSLARITHENLVQVVASPPDQWGITMKERVALVEYLSQRQGELLSGDLGDRQPIAGEGG